MRSLRTVVLPSMVVVFVVFILKIDRITGDSKTCRRGLKTVTWNIAAINNNPFEYWNTYPDPEYAKLMNGVEVSQQLFGIMIEFAFLECILCACSTPRAHKPRKFQDFVGRPWRLGDAVENGSAGAMDAAVHRVFTDAMAKELFADMTSKNIEGVAKVEELWTSEYRNRKIISGFIKDKNIGKKRLASMPDRVTNTIDLGGGNKAMRPTVINCFHKEISDLSSWWRQWRNFMFVDSLDLGKPGKPGRARVPFELLQPILKSKYPDISESEQEVSIALQLLCLAIFDTILVHMMQHLGAATWQPIRKNICDALNAGKNDKVKAILKSTYQDAHAIMLQETAPAFVDDLRDDAQVADKYLILAPAEASSKRNQNSVILLDSRVFVKDSVAEVTDKILKYDHSKAISAPGDVMAVTAKTTGGKTLLLVSFHGDTNGQATKPLVRTILASLQSDFPAADRPILLLGMDGNTYKMHSESYQGVADLQYLLASNGLTSVWGDNPDPLAPTTCNARTYLQVMLAPAPKTGPCNARTYLH